MKKIFSIVLVLSLLCAMFAVEVQGAGSGAPSLSVEVKSANEIVVTWENVTQETMGSPSTSIQIRRGDDTGTGVTLAYHYAYNTTENNGASGSVTFSNEYAGSDNRKANFPLTDGNYYAILRLNDGSLVESTKTEFTVGAPPAPPELSVQVNNANEIVVNWKNVVQEEIGSPSVSIQVRKGSDTGTGTSLAYHYVYNTTVNNGVEGTVTFSNEYAGSDNRKENFPLEEGTYYVILRLDNGSLMANTKTEFTVSAVEPSATPSEKPVESPSATPESTLEATSSPAPNQPTGDTSLLWIISVMLASAVVYVMIKRKIKV